MTKAQTDIIAAVVRDASLAREADREQLTRDFLYRFTDRYGERFDRARFASIAMERSGPGAMSRVL